MGKIPGEKLLIAIGFTDSNCKQKENNSIWPKTIVILHIVLLTMIIFGTQSELTILFAFRRII
jgi:hypothetical protein